MNIWDKAIEFLVSCIGQSAVDAWRQTSAIDADLSNLQAALPKAWLLIERSECWRSPRSIDELLPQLKDAVYEAESIVDELEYQRLKNEVEKSFPGSNFFKNWMNNFPSTVRSVLHKLDYVHDQLEKTCNSLRVPENPNQFSETARPATSTFIGNSKVYGRDKDEEKLIRLLRVTKSQSSGKKRAREDKGCASVVGESSRGMNNKENVILVSIVGMGGVGKTTLAQLICNDRNVKSYFELILWVCISDNFDVARLIKEIIHCANKTEYDLSNMNSLQLNLQEILQSKRFLLVLDDAWSESEVDWKSLLDPVRGGFGGSAVLVTTRSQKVADIAGKHMDIRRHIYLKGLEENVYWEFFRSCAFSVEEVSKCCPELQIIGKEICKKLKGSPLAAKTIGGLLRINSNVRHWSNIRDSEIWQLKQKEHDILPVLQLSYQYLPSHLKRCFSFCSLFPKDFKFKKDKLIEFWIMHGLLNSVENSQHVLQAQTEDYFNELEMRCFFQRAPRCRDSYVIHDLMHDVCQYVTKDECFCIEDADFENNVSINIRHLSISGKGIKKEEQMKLCKYEKLLSVRVGPQSSCFFTVISKWCEKLTNIRSLSIPKCKFQYLPKSIGKLTHLQYLDMSFSDINELPESFCSLYNLLYLNMEGCESFMFFPEGFKKLVNLRFFYLPIQKLILVGHIENFARKIDREDMSIKVSTHVKLENLKFMNNLKGDLKIENLELVTSRQASEEAHLNNKELISRLSLYWSEYNDRAGDESLRVGSHDEEVLQGLCPHPNLKELKIHGYGGRNLPQSGWLGPNHLPGLQELVIEDCPQLVSIAQESFLEFVSLKKLKISNCPKLTWPNAVVLPPSIEILELRSFGDLANSIPSFMQNLTYLLVLDIGGCPSLESLTAEALRNLKSLSSLSIEECAGLQSIAGLDVLVSLRILNIESCPRLISIQADVPSNLKSLTRVRVSNCAELQSLGGLLYLTSLEDIYILRCPKLQETSGRLIFQSSPLEMPAEMPSSSSGGKRKPEIGQL